MTDQELDAVLARMERYGGGFAQALAVTIRRADANNRRILLDAFAHLLTQYRGATPP